ncbi:MAG: ribose-phosphate pyrophosphokinase [Kofleriaceae bacterium]|jgi:ribose-phosphate pyrophosphokinase|nr:ribose-phosphate pyrophosphokinase [Kofleriaceae bacterium]MBP6841161.1 ribose-phosphate pyrophosphokinase [Kofleriaceae bacterium]MBP9207191.1 ribose-phosphate pyrophosphokinase [Kofleriaceae bacterium]
MTTPLLFATSSYQYLATSLVAASGWQAGTIDRTTFPDGEHYYRLTSDPADRDVVLLGGTIDDQETLELYDLACGLVAGGAYRLTLVLPFYGYGTMERAVRPGEIVTAKNRARLLSSIPMASRGTQVFLLDLHVGAVTHYFEGGIRPVHVYGKEVVVAAARRLAASHGGDFVLACTDAGRAKWVESLANDLGVPAAFVYKRRIAGDTTEVTGVSAQVAGKQVIIYDDMIRTGGSLLSAARAYRDAGAVAIDAIATHGLFPADSLDRLQASGLLGRIVVTDSHPRAHKLRGTFLQVDSIAPLLVEHLIRNR